MSSSIDQPAIEVVTAVIRRGSQVFLARRPLEKHQGGKLEFPGGKREPGESRLQALSRELQEELGITPAECTPLIQVAYRYPEKNVHLDVWEVSDWQGTPHGREGQETGWYDVKTLKAEDFPPANRAILTAACLPRYYFISPEPDSASLDALIHSVKQSAARPLVFALRSKKLTDDAYLQLLVQIKEQIPEITFMLHERLNLLSRCHADGVHLTSRQLWNLTQGECHALRKQVRWLAASCHNLEDIRKANELGLDFVVLSPVQQTASHPEAEPLGLEKFARLVRDAEIPVFALGGMAWSNFNEVVACGAQGLAGISMFLSEN